MKNLTEQSRKKVKQHIREKAISRAKTRIYLHGKRPEEYEAEILEAIVKEEEDKIKSDYKNKSIVMLLAALGLSFWT
ncbi:MAG: dihydrouridine synthase [Cellvibrionaceae bacterium]|nr:dihydrouridine synthase [Cellvibrionaceae bacterium]